MKVSNKIIKAVSLFVAKKDPRYYIQEINFELHWDKTIVTGTDGIVLLSIMIDEPNEKEDNLSIPPASFPKTDIDYEITRADDGKVYVTNGMIKVEVPQNGARFPDFRRIIPSKPEENPAHVYFDPERSVLFKKASKLLGGKQYPLVHANGLVDMGLLNCVGVQASLRGDDADKETASVFRDGCGPQWATTGSAPKKYEPPKEEDSKAA